MIITCFDTAVEQVFDAKEDEQHEKESLCKPLLLHDKIHVFMNR